MHHTPAQTANSPATPEGVTDDVYTTVIEGPQNSLSAAALPGAIIHDGRLHLFRAGASDIDVAASVRDELAQTQTAWTAIRVLAKPPAVQVTPADAARLVGVSERTVASLVHGGALAVSPDTGKIEMSRLLPLVAVRRR